MTFGAPLVTRRVPPLVSFPEGNPSSSRWRMAPSGLRAVCLAVSLADPFANPAMGARLTGSRFFGSPALYSVSRNAGGGRSLPFAVLTRRAMWYGGLALALQQVDPSRPPQPDGFFLRRGAVQVLPNSPDPVIPGPDTRAHGNEYAFAMVGL